MPETTSQNYVAGRRRSQPALIWRQGVLRPHDSATMMQAAWPDWKDSAKSSLLASFAKHLCHDESRAACRPFSNLGATARSKGTFTD